MKPIVIAFYTTDELYRRQAARLEASIKRFELEHRIKSIDPSTWMRAIAYKPTFIAEMLREHMDRDLLYVDADAEFVQYPKLFDTPYPYDVGIFDRPNTVPHAATMFFKAGSYAAALVARWERLMIENPKKTDQGTLRLALNTIAGKGGVSVGQLPHAYCCKVDEQNRCPELPVIIQHQASRSVPVKT